MSAGYGRPSGLERTMERLFQRYCDGFNDYDVESVLDCFAYPVTIWQLGRGTVFEDAKALAENVEALLEVFEAEDIVRSQFRMIEAMAHGNAAFVALEWLQERADGEIGAQFECRYALRRNDLSGEWLITLLINDEEVSPR